MKLLLLGALLFAVLCYCADQDVLTILNQQTGISTFIRHLQSYPDLIETLNAGTYTVLAPNDEAFSDFVAENPSSANDSDFMEALVRYHIAHNTHPSAEFGLNPLFPATLLTSPTYTNVTGGQRIELMLLDSRPTILSGVKAPSHLLNPDIFFQGGLIHITSSVLTIPLSFPSTITRAKLTHLVALLNKGGWLNPSSPAVSIVNDLPDLTVFGPNSPSFGAGFTGFDSLSQPELDAIFRYSIVQDSPPLYSSELRNATRHATLQNSSSLLLTQSPSNASTFYADAAEITTTDYLTSNGVLHLLSAPLNPLTSGIGPSLAPPTPPPSSFVGLSTPALAGLVIGILALLLGVALILALVLRGRRRRGHTTGWFGGLGKGMKGERMPEEETPGIPRGTRSKRLASPGEGWQGNGDASAVEGLELASAQPPRYGAHELDNKEFSGARVGEGGGVGNRGTVSVVEIHNHHYGGGPDVGPQQQYGYGYGYGYPSSMGVPESSVSDSARSGAATDGSAAPPRVVYPVTRAVDANGRTVTVYGGDGKPLPPKPPSPQEIDGEERSRISISISGERPRHLGFQATY